jgi:hypothetical protein
MPMKQQDMLLSILQSAAAEPIGIVIQTSDTARAKAALYRARSVCHDPALMALQIRTSPWKDQGDLLICHSQSTTKPMQHNLGAIDLSDILDDLS